MRTTRYPRPPGGRGGPGMQCVLVLSAICLTPTLSGADHVSSAGVRAPAVSDTTTAGADLADFAPEGDRTMPLLVDAHPSQPNLSTLISVLHPMLQSAGQTEWSTDRLRGVTGHAFAFEMRKGGGEVWHDANLDWWLWYDLYPLIARFRVFHATRGGPRRRPSRPQGRSEGCRSGEPAKGNPRPGLASDEP